ncbi:DNA transposase THAP9 [Eumeta japonica]|uniref:DNA transposase THAP9 n=1 Tax=Eumeta variegata TaxID=151549 RepID=A0A4C1UN28_EUMVA|nr:DNA transposase THAP9 [Eumeta japonica]
MFSKRAQQARGSRSDEDLEMRFPHDPNIQEKWIRIVQDDRREWDWLPSHSSVVCSDHFSESDRYKTEKGRYFLKKDVIPIIKGQDVQYGRSVSPISVAVSDTNSIFDTPHMIYLKKKIRKMELVKEKHVRTIKNLRKVNNRIKKKTTTLAKTLRILNNKNATDRDTTDLDLPGDGDEVHKKVIFKNKKDYMNTSSRYPTHLGKFALNVNCNSSASYKHLRKIVTAASPNSNTPCIWYNDSDGNPGFTQEAFAALLDKHRSVNGERLTCGLIISNMALRQQKI